ncbi:Triacylglycerol Lipase [Musa troglodytarum]|uniref:Triacylglycerol Lipase n=1 Tax=Musa troglodytarum TaxID=320322 RepID=A0A9E7HVT6_9LILI|nr:Triacylglycerol Lipase [Musa troglodytarum]
MARLSIGILGLTELLVSAAVHLLFGFYIFSTAVASDLSQALTDCFRPSVLGLATGDPEEGRNRQAAVLDASPPPPPPIVLVHGIFGFGKGKLGGLSYFAGAEKKDGHVLVPDLGALTSIHDRARELFYYLKGGQVDYGEEHSRSFGHARLGKTYERGHHPSWDEHHPVHFVGHSAGVQVARVLQQMLAEKAFSGYDTCEDWVLSVTSLSGALNGTTRTYYDGMRPGNGRTMKSVCLLQLCRIGATLFDWLDIAWLKNYYNFGFDHFEMGWRKTGVSGLAELLLGNAGPFATGDWILPDLTIEGSIELNSGLRTFPNTFYFGYATKRTRKMFGLTVPSAVLGIHPLLFLRVLQMCRWRFPRDAASSPYKGYRDEDWEDNDGALNTISMTHPRLPVEHPSLLVADDSKCLPLQPGIWYYKIIEADHIFFILNRERAGAQFDLMYDGIFQRCRKHMFRSQ